MPQTEERVIAIYVYVILIIAYLLTCSSFLMYGVSAHSPWWTHFTHIFCHASILHLLINLYILYRLSIIRSTVPYRIATGAVIAVLSSFIYISPQLVTVGFSGAVFAMLGISTSEHYTHKTFMIILASILPTIFLPSVAFITHSLCFAIGFIYHRSYKYLTEYIYDNK